MLCRHREILFEWPQATQRIYRASCQHCAQKFDVVAIEHDEPDPETNWQWGSVRMVELIREEGDGQAIPSA